MTVTTYPYGTYNTDTGYTNQGGNSMWPAAIIGGIGQLAGGLISSRGQRSANRMNYQIAKENREWQEMMSNTAYQRAAKDLEAAGLNRILALGNSASTPSGNTATMQNVNQALGDAVSKSPATALALARQTQELKLLKEQTRNVNADTNLKNENSMYIQDQASNTRATWTKIQREIENVIAQTNLTTAKGGKEALQSSLYDMIPQVAEMIFRSIGIDEGTITKLLSEYNKRKNNP